VPLMERSFNPFLFKPLTLPSILLIDYSVLILVLQIVNYTVKIKNKNYVYSIRTIEYRP